MCLVKTGYSTFPDVGGWGGGGGGVEEEAYSQGARGTYRAPPPRNLPLWFQNVP